MSNNVIWITTSGFQIQLCCLCLSWVCLYFRIFYYSSLYICGFCLFALRLLTMVHFIIPLCVTWGLLPVKVLFLTRLYASSWRSRLQPVVQGSLSSILWVPSTLRLQLSCTFSAPKRQPILFDLSCYIIFIDLRFELSFPLTGSGHFELLKVVLSVSYRIQSNTFNFCILQWTFIMCLSNSERLLLM